MFLLLQRFGSVTRDLYLKYAYGDIVNAHTFQVIFTVFKSDRFQVTLSSSSAGFYISGRITLYIKTPLMIGMKLKLKDFTAI
jgi:hypothetical protein